MTSLPHQIINRRHNELLAEARQPLDYAPSSEAERVAAEEQRNEFRRDAYLVQRALLGADHIASQLLDMAIEGARGIVR